MCSLTCQQHFNCSVVSFNHRTKKCVRGGFVTAADVVHVPAVAKTRNVVDVFAVNRESEIN